MKKKNECLLGFKHAALLFICNPENINVMQVNAMLLNKIFITKISAAITKNVSRVPLRYEMYHNEKYYKERYHKERFLLSSCGDKERKKT